MALINCPECSAEASDKAAACPKCGFPLAGPAVSPSSWFAGSSNIKGWLLLPAFWLPFMIWRTLVGFRDWTSSEPDGMVQLLGTSDTMAGYIVLGHVLLLAGFLGGTVAFWQEKQRAPAILITTFSIQLAVIVMTLVEFARAADAFGANSAWDRNRLVVLVAVVLIVYLVRSKRVEDTFVE